MCSRLNTSWPLRFSRNSSYLMRPARCEIHFIMSLMAADRSRLEFQVPSISGLVL